MAGLIDIQGPLEAALIVKVKGQTKTHDLSENLAVARVTLRSTCGINDAAVDAFFPVEEAEEVVKDLQFCSHEVEIARKDPQDPVIFRGHAEKVDFQRISSLGVVSFRARDKVGLALVCQPVSKEYFGTPAHDIVNDLMGTYMPTTPRVVETTGPTLQHVRFQDVYLSEALKRLSLLSGFAWWVDVDTFRWEDPAAHPFPADITTEGPNATIIGGGTGVRRDMTLVRNKVIIFSQGENDGTYSTSYAGDGVTTEFPTKFQSAPDLTSPSHANLGPKKPVVQVIDPYTGTTTTLDVGRGNIDSFTGTRLDQPHSLDGTPPPIGVVVPAGDGLPHDALFYPDPLIETTIALPIGLKLVQTFDRMVPTKREFNDVESQAECGVRTEVIPSSTVQSDDQARDVGTAIIRCLGKPDVRGDAKLISDKIAGVFVRPASTAKVVLPEQSIDKTAEVRTVTRVFYNQPVERLGVNERMWDVFRSAGVVNAAKMPGAIDVSRRMETLVEFGCCHSADTTEEVVKKIVSTIVGIQEVARPVYVRPRV